MTANSLRAALYARVSTEHQAKANTIGSQMDAIKLRIAQDGLKLDPELEFVDDGYSGEALERPALERLRDQVAAGAVNRVYVLSPDRLARKYAYQVLLVEELQQAGTEVVFLNHPVQPDARRRVAPASPGHHRRIRAGQDPGAQPAREARSGPGGRRERLQPGPLRISLH